jgi:hypothetical protein
MNNYEFEDAHNSTMVAAAVGNKDCSKNDGDNENDRQTSSDWSNLIVRIFFTCYCF